MSVVECVCNPMANYLTGAITFATVQAGGLDFLFALIKPFIPQSIYYTLFFLMCGLKIAFRMCLQKFWSGVAFTKTYVHDTFFVNKDQSKENVKYSEDQDDDEDSIDSETKSQLEQCSDALITEPKNSSSWRARRCPWPRRRPCPRRFPQCSTARSSPNRTRPPGPRG